MAHDPQNLAYWTQHFQYWLRFSQKGRGRIGPCSDFSRTNHRHLHLQPFSRTTVAPQSDSLSMAIRIHTKQAVLQPEVEFIPVNPLSMGALIEIHQIKSILEIVAEGVMEEKHVKTRSRQLIF